MSKYKHKAYDMLYTKLNLKEEKLLISQLRPEKNKGDVQGVVDV